jgi:hypothetical protein
MVHYSSYIYMMVYKNNNTWQYIKTASLHVLRVILAIYEVVVTLVPYNVYWKNTFSVLSQPISLFILYCDPVQYALFKSSMILISIKR